MPKKKEAPKPKKDKSEDRMDKLIIADMEKLIADGYPEHARSFKRLYDEYNRVRNDAEDARKSEREAWAQNNSLTIELGAKKAEADNLNVSFVRFEEMFSKQNMQFNELKFQVKAAERRMKIAEMDSLNLLSTLATMKARQDELYETIPEKLRTELRRNTEITTSALNNILMSLKGTVQQPTIVATPPTIVEKERK